MGKNNNLLSSLKYDLPSSIVVFLVALPLCLGIALAAGAPNLFSGLIAGIVGGIVVGAISKSHTSVSGPTASLLVIMSTGIIGLGSYQVFLSAVVLAGVFQILMGVARAGLIGNFFPVSVIKGMLAAIGLILVLKQIPHFLGYDNDFEGDESFIHATSYQLLENIDQMTKQNTFTDIFHAFYYPNTGSIIIGTIALLILVVWGHHKVRSNRILSLVPAPLLVVFVSVGINAFFRARFPGLFLSENHLVQVPIPNSFGDFKSQFMFPDFSLVLNPKVWVVAFTIALISSLETLLSIDAADKLDPWRRKTPNNRELIAQGTGNIVSGLIGGLPLTAVIVRSSTNIAAGSRTKVSAILHGVFLLLAVAFIPGLLNLIPKAALAAILLQVGVKLVKPSIFFDMYTKGWSQFIPFVVTIVAIMFTDMLLGFSIGMGVGIYYVIKTNYRSAIVITHDNQNYLIRFKRDVSFLNKYSLRKIFDRIPEASFVIIDINKNLFVDQDIRETIEDFKKIAVNKDIIVEIKYSKI